VVELLQLCARARALCARPRLHGSASEVVGLVNGRVCLSVRLPTCAGSASDVVELMHACTAPQVRSRLLQSMQQAPLPALAAIAADAAAVATLSRWLLEAVETTGADSRRMLADLLQVRRMDRQRIRLTWAPTTGARSPTCCRCDGWTDRESD
jgi:hypothetical protein